MFVCSQILLKNIIPLHFKFRKYLHNYNLPLNIYNIEIMYPISRCTSCNLFEELFFKSTHKKLQHREEEEGKYEVKNNIKYTF